MSETRVMMTSQGILHCLTVAILLSFCGCDGSTSEAPVPPAAQLKIELPQVEQRLCTAVVILIDTSTSMLNAVKDSEGRRRSKAEIAREALEQVIRTTGERTRARPELRLELGIYRFSDTVSQILAMDAFNEELALDSLANLRTSSGTAIGRALEVAFRSVHATGCVRKHVLCITDGDNSSGPSPEQVGKALHAASGGDTAIHFIAFNTSSKKFAFLEKIGGEVVEAMDGAQLVEQLSEIYEKRILAEAEPEDG